MLDFGVLGDIWEEQGGIYCWNFPSISCYSMDWWVMLKFMFIPLQLLLLLLFPFKIHLALWSWKWYRVFVSGSLNFSNKSNKVPLICILQTIIAWLAFLYIDLVIIEKLVYYSTNYWKSQSLDSVNLSKFEQNQMLMKLHILQCIQVPLWAKSKRIVEVQYLIGCSWGGMMT